MERKTAERRLKRPCTYCKYNFKKGDVYYIEKDIDLDIGFFETECNVCPKCKYKNEQSKKRFYKNNGGIFND